MGVKLIWGCGGHAELKGPIQNTAEGKMVPLLYALVLLSHRCCFVVEFLGNSGWGGDLDLMLGAGPVETNQMGGKGAEM